jgi:hypothetical protein
MYIDYWTHIVGRADMLAQRALGGAELENGCQRYTDKAVKHAQAWEKWQCRK